MLKVMFKSKCIRVFAVVILAISIASCFTAKYIVSALEGAIANIPENDIEDTGSGKYMTYTMDHPCGYTAKGNDSGWAITDQKGKVIYETDNKVELANREGYIYETDEKGTCSIVNVYTGKVEWTLAQDEEVVEDDAGFWVIMVKVDDEKFFSQNYYYLLDENYEIGADGAIFNDIGNDKSFGHMENYIYGSKEVNYTMNNSEGIENREKSSETCVINSNGEIVYSTTDGEVLFISDEGMARVTFYYDEKDDVYVSLSGPKKGQVVEVIKDE